MPTPRILGPNMPCFACLFHERKRARLHLRGTQNPNQSLSAWQLQETRDTWWFSIPFPSRLRHGLESYKTTTWARILQFPNGSFSEVVRAISDTSQRAQIRACGKNGKHTHTHTNTRTHEHTNTRTHEHTNTWTHEHMNTRTHEHMNTQTHEHTNTRTHEHAHTHTHTNMTHATHTTHRRHTHKRMSIHTYVCMCIYIYANTHVYVYAELLFALPPPPPFCCVHVHSNALMHVSLRKLLIHFWLLMRTTKVAEQGLSMA